MAVPLSDDGREALDGATHKVSESFVQHRYSAVPMECRGDHRRVGAVRPAARRVAREPEPARGAAGVRPRDRRAREQRSGWRSVTSAAASARSCSSAARRSPSSWPRTCSDARSSGSRTGARTSSRRRTRARSGSTRRWRRRRRHHPGVPTSTHLDDAGAFPMPGGSAGPLVGMLFPGPYKVPRLGWSSTTRLHEHVRQRARTAARGCWRPPPARR